MTAQKMEILFYNKKKLGMISFPLNQFLLNNKPNIELIPTSSALWRGYLGQWEIYRKRLYLVSLKGEGCEFDVDKFRSERLKLRKKLKSGQITPQENGLLLKKLKKKCQKYFTLSVGKLFGTNQKVPADWFTGKLCIPYGKVLKYINQGFGAIHEKELHIIISEGKILGTSVKKNELKEYKNYPFRMLNGNK